MTSDGTSLYWVEFNDNTIRQGVLANQQVSTMIGTACNSTGTCLPLDSCTPGYTEGVGAAAVLGAFLSLARAGAKDRVVYFDEEVRDAIEREIVKTLGGSMPLQAIFFDATKK